MILGLEVRKRMRINFLGEIEEIINTASLLVSDMGFSVSEGEKNVSVSKSEKGFEVSVNGNNAKISYNTKTDFYRGLSFIVDAFKKGTDFSITQQPVFENCGIMLDVSRGAVIKVEKVKEIIGLIARMGFNQLMLYTEDVYEMKKYPYFGYMRGRYTTAELKEIVSYAGEFGIETIPCIQTLGHLAYPLRWQEFDDMKESDAVLFVGEDKTYELIDEMIKTMRDCFTSSKIHIGMDEAHGIGLNRYLLKHGYRNRFEILSEHLGRVLDICKKYDFAPMMWSDMFFRLGSKKNSYYDWDNKLPENIAELIPDGVSQVYWDYYSHSESLYDIMFSEHKRMNCPIIFAGGVWTWSGPSVSNVQSFEGTIPALNSCLKQEIKDVVATLWGDEGSECDVFQSLYGLQLYAEYNYNHENPLGELDKMFEICTGYGADAFKLLDIDDFGLPTYEFDKVEFEDLELHIVNTSKQILYQNPLMGMIDKNIESENISNHYQVILDKLNKAVTDNSQKLLFDCHKQLLKVLISKSTIGNRLKKAYDNKNMSELKILSEELLILADELKELRRLRKDLWYENNKPFGFELVNQRLASVEALTQLAHDRVEQYICGEVNFLEELEQERLYYNGIEIPYFMEYFANRVMMP